MSKNRGCFATNGRRLINNWYPVHPCNSLAALRAARGGPADLHHWIGRGPANLHPWIGRPSIQALAVGQSTGGGARAKPSRLVWRKCSGKWEVLKQNAGRYPHENSKSIGVWALGLFLLISQSLSTGRQRVVFPWPKIGVVLDF